MRNFCHHSQALPLLLCAWALSPFIGSAQSQDLDLQLHKLYQSQIPKQETGVIQFLEQHPEYDGRDVTIAIFDTGVDPAAPGMQTTSTGERKLIDIYDASGAGDVDTTSLVEATADGTLNGLTGRTLVLPENLNNPSGKFRIGIKFGKELFHEDVWTRVMDYRNHQMKNLALEKKAALLKAKALNQQTETIHPWSKLEAETEEKAFEAYLKTLKTLDKGPIYDCVVWKGSDDWHVLIDTDEDGDLRDEKILRPFAAAGEWASFPDYVSMNFGVQVLDDGNLLSIVTTSGSHGTHVASIAAGHFPHNSALDGVAPGARILSIRIGDIRAGGSSTYLGENLAVAIAAQYKVDLMNASWGGQSYYQNASAWGVQLYNLLVQKYGVTAFVSTGNDGPALSTMGSPGGEAYSVIGVGAYVSPQMGQLLYSVVGNTPSSTFMFSARGPSRNGDLGVDIIAPGAAITSLAMDSLYGSDLYNGTSMASPSAAGVGALLVSAAKHEGLRTSPARIRYALMNTAHPLESEDPFAQGAGLIHAGAAWDHLQRFQSVDALDLFYKVDVSGNTYASGPGLYLRTDAENLKGKQNYRISIQPEFPDAFDNSDQYDLNLYLQSEKDVDWLQTAEFIHLSNAGKTIRPEVDFDSFPDSDTSDKIHYSSLNFRLVDAPEAGPLIRIPFTIANSRPESEGRWLSARTFTLTGSTSYRRLFTPPTQTNHLSLSLRRSDDGDVEKLFVFHALTLLANKNTEAMEIRRYLRLKPGEEAIFEIPALAGEPMEINVHQVWSDDAPTQLSLQGMWRSMIPDSDTTLVFDDGRPGTLNLVSRFDSKIKVSASVNRAVLSYLPETSSIIPYDKRGNYPKGMRDAAEQPTFLLHQEFTVPLKEPLEIQFQLVQHATEFVAGGGIVEIYDEQGFPVATDLAPTDEERILSLPAGNNLLVREFVSPDTDVLDRLKELPIEIHAKIKEQPLQTYQGFEQFSKNVPTATLDLQGDRFESLLLKADEAFVIEKLPKNPDFLLGEIKFKEDEVTITTTNVVAIPHATSTTISDNKESTTDDSPTTIDSTAQLQAAIYEKQLLFLRNTRESASPAIKKERAALLKTLLKDSTDPKLWLEEIYSLAVENHLLHPWFFGSESTQPVEAPASKGEEIERKITRMIQNCHPDKVAEYLGAPPVVDVPESTEGMDELRREKNFKKLSNYLCEADLIAADMYLVLGNLEKARAFLNESKRWTHQKELDGISTKLEVRLLIAEQKPALALTQIHTLLEKTPRDAMLMQWRSKAYNMLGWTLHQELESRYEEVSKNALKLR